MSRGRTVAEAAWTILGSAGVDWKRYRLVRIQCRVCGAIRTVRRVRFDAGGARCRECSRIKTGARFGAWTVLRVLGYQSKNLRVMARCVCGAERPVWLHHLKRGHSRSCGRKSCKTAGLVAALRSQLERCEHNLERL